MFNVSVHFHIIMRSRFEDYSHASDGSRRSALHHVVANIFSLPIAIWDDAPGIIVGIHLEIYVTWRDCQYRWGWYLRCRCILVLVSNQR